MKTVVFYYLAQILSVKLDKNPSLVMLGAVQRCKTDKYQIVDRADCPRLPRNDT